MFSFISIYRFYLKKKWLNTDPFAVTKEMKLLKFHHMSKILQFLS